jgi:hypothetical protein
MERTIAGIKSPTKEERKSTELTAEDVAAFIAEISEANESNHELPIPEAKPMTDSASSIASQEARVLAEQSRNAFLNSQVEDCKMQIEMLNAVVGETHHILKEMHSRWKTDHSVISTLST